MLNEEYVLAKNFGFLCYLPEGYSRYIKKKEEKEAEEARKIESKYFGEIGKRYKDKVIQDLTLVTSWYNYQWGATYIYKITLEDESVLTWKTSNSLYLEENEQFDKISFTVKEHKEYKGEKQTEVTRCKLNIKVA